MHRVKNKFFCLNCGKEGIPCVRSNGKQKKGLHRKKLYCPWCKVTVNFAEVRNDADKEKFLKEFAAGAYKEEAAQSIEECKKEEWKWLSL